MGIIPARDAGSADGGARRSGRWLTGRLSPWLGVVVFALLCAHRTVDAAPAFTATLDRNVVPVGESVTLTLTFEGVSPGGAPELPPLPNLTVGGVSTSSEFSIVNGRQTSRRTYHYTLTTRKVGEITIPAMQIEVENTTVASTPLQLKVVPAGTKPPIPGGSSNSLTNLAFLRLVVPRTEVYVGEPFPVEMQLYWQNADEIRMPQLHAEGFSLSQIPKPGQSRTQVGNAIYNLVVFRLTATAARSGALKLGPAEESLNILIQVNDGQRGRDPFQSIFGFGPQYQRVPTTLTSDTVMMQVQPLPSKDVPEGFNGAIGNYAMTVSAGPTKLAVGDPITLRVQLSGRGPLDSLSLPPQPQWRDFTSYPPTAKVEPNDELGLVGRKSFEQILIPQNHEIKELPPVRFSFFDPEAKTYRTLTGPTVPLEVRASATAAAPPPSLTNSNAGGTAPPVDDILHIKPRLELAGTALPLMVGRPWFAVLATGPIFIWLGLLVWRKRTESLAGNPRLRRQREVAARVRAGLKELRTQAGAQQSEQFFATLFRLLQEQLGERLDLPASAITEAVIEEKLRGRELSGTTFQSLHELFQACNVARYAPNRSSQELNALIPKLEAVLQDLQTLKV